MKSATDPRHVIRRRIVKELFANEFASQLASPTTTKIIKKSKKLDELIKNSAGQWPIDRINKVDLAILRLGVWEILENKTSFKVIIDEAIELAKEYGSEKSPPFINAVLGNIVNEKNRKN